MFDVGFSELMLIAIVALVVLGPERLPKVARTAGHLLGRLQRYVNDVKSDISREMQLEDLRKMRQDMESSARDFESSVHKELTAVDSHLNRSFAGDNSSSPDSPPASPETPAALATPEPPAAPPLDVGEPSPQLELGLDGTTHGSSGKS